MTLPILEIEVFGYLFGTVLAALSLMWSVNKAIIIAKSH